MANNYDKYQKLKLQYTYGPGDGYWIDVEPPRYKAGELIEKNSPDCGGVNRLYRWYALSNDYICQGYNKYYKEVYQVSMNNGLTWENVEPYQERVGELIETNSIDCDYGVEWKLIQDEYICETTDATDCYITFMLGINNRDRVITYAPYKTYKYPETVGYLDCGIERHTIEGDDNIYTLDMSKIDSYTYSLTLNVSSSTKVKTDLVLPKPDFLRGLPYINNAWNICTLNCQQINTINWNSFVEAPNTTYESVIGKDEEGNYTHGLLGKYKIGGYDYLSIGGVILPNYMIDYMFYNSFYSYFYFSNFTNGNVVLKNYDYRKSKVGTDTFSDHLRSITIYSDNSPELYDYYNKEKSITISNISYADSLDLTVTINGETDKNRRPERVLIDGIYQTKLFGGEILHNAQKEEDIEYLDAALFINVGFLNELTIKHINVEYFYYKSNYSDGRKIPMFTIQICGYDDTVSQIYFEDINLPSEYLDWGMEFIILSANKKCNITITNCSSTFTQMVENAVSKIDNPENITITKN